MAEAPTTNRLKSRKPLYKSQIEGFDAQETWEKEWKEKPPPGGDIITRLGEKMPGFRDGQRKQWVATNRLRSQTGRTAANMHKWNLSASPTCPHCGQCPQDTDHLVLHCPITKLNGGYASIHSFDETYIEWLENVGQEI